MWWFLRHGATEFNRHHRIQGKSDIPLSDLGRQQAHQLVDTTQFDPLPEIIYSSPLLRARNTAEVVANALKLPLILDERLMEWNCGDAEGESLEAYLQNHPDFSIVWDDLDFRYPHGESKRELCHRGSEFVAMLRNETRVPLVVAHQAILNCVIFSALGLPESPAMPLRLGNCGLALIKPGIPYGRMILFQGAHTMPWDPPHHNGIISEQSNPTPQ